MKVIRYYPPGGLPQLKIQEEPKPSQLADKEVLIKVCAVSIIAPELEWPMYQDTNGNWKTAIVGQDFSGVVESVGPNVEGSDFGVGTEVIAFTSELDEQGQRIYDGAMADYAKAAVRHIVPKPRNLGLVESASVPLSSLTAWQALFDQTTLKPGQRLLVTGAAGPTGLWIVQVAKWIGAHVTGTASSARSFELLKEYGVDEIADYKTQQVVEVVKDVDLVIDCVGGSALEQAYKVVKKEGLVISLVDFECESNANAAGVRGKFFIVEMNAEQLRKISKLIEERVFKTTVDSVFAFDDYEKAYEKGLSGRSHGKILLQI